MSISYRWIKLYIEILDDPKMGLLPNHLWRRTIEFFLMAGECGKGGALGSVPEIAWRLRVSEADLLQSLRSLEEIGIVHCTQENTWVVSKFAERQAAEPSKERTEAYRKRERTRDSNEPVTTRDIEENREDKKRIEENVVVGAVYRQYEQEIGAITKVIADEIAMATEIYPLEWFGPAFQESARQNHRSWSYAHGILRNWKANGYRSKNGKSAKKTGVLAEAWEKLERGESLS